MSDGSNQFGQNPYEAKSSPAQPSGHGDKTGGVIPYKNPQALIGYYLGFGSLLPLIGLPFTIPAIVLGIMGLAKYKKNPVIKGQVHAWIGIIFGFIGLLGSGGCLLLAIIGPFLG